MDVQGHAKMHRPGNANAWTTAIRALVQLTRTPVLVGLDTMTIAGAARRALLIQSDPGARPSTLQAPVHALQCYN